MKMSMPTAYIGINNNESRLMQVPAVVATMTFFGPGGATHFPAYPLSKNSKSQQRRVGN